MVAGPVSDAEMTAAEDVLGVVFPTQYRDFLAEFGAVLVKGLEIYGLVDAAKNDPPLWNDVVDVTGQLRDWGQVGTERNCFLPISDDGTGVYFYLDTERSDLAEIWAIGPGIKRIVAGDLHQFAMDFTERNLAL